MTDVTITRDPGSLYSLIELLTARQRACEQSDAAFAARLGIARSTWTLVRNGDKGVGRRTLAAIVGAFGGDAEVAAACDAYAAARPFFWVSR